jgi:parallel beta-helix repeat protein
MHSYFSWSPPVHRTFYFLILIACFFAMPHFAFGACDLNATTSNFASQLAAAQPGQTLCLASGNYGKFNGVVKTTPGVTITAASGATPTMSISFLMSPGAAWLTLDHLTISGGTITGPTNHVTFQNNVWTDKLVIWPKGANNFCSGCPDMSNASIVFDNEMFNLAANQSGSGGYEGRIQLADGGSSPQGITIRNSKFTTGCADGIQVSGSNAGYGVTIGPNNEFYNLAQGNCGAHVDSIQFVGTGAIGPVITSNYFHDNTDGIVMYDWRNNAQINNNVFVRIDHHSINAGGLDSNSVVDHNTVIGDNIDCSRSRVNDGTLECYAVFRNNIAANMTAVGGGTSHPSYSDYNLCTDGSAGCPGSHSLIGRPTYVGGTNPSTYAGFALASGSLGRNAGSDGKDMGINISTASIAAPTNLSTTPR